MATNVPWSRWRRGSGHARRAPARCAGPRLPRNHARCRPRRRRPRRRRALRPPPPDRARRARASRDSPAAPDTSPAASAATNPTTTPARLIPMASACPTGPARATALRHNRPRDRALRAVRAADPRARGGAKRAGSANSCARTRERLGARLLCWFWGCVVGPRCSGLFSGGCRRCSCRTTCGCGFGWCRRRPPGRLVMRTRPVFRLVRLR